MNGAWSSLNQLWLDGGSWDSQRQSERHHSCSIFSMFMIDTSAPSDYLVQSSVNKADKKANKSKKKH